MDLHFSSGINGSARTIAVEMAVEAYKLDCARRLNRVHPDAQNDTPYNDTPYLKKRKKKRKTYAY